MSKPFSGKDWLHKCPKCGCNKSNVIRYLTYEKHKCFKCKHKFIYSFNKEEIIDNIKKI